MGKESLKHGNKILRMATLTTNLENARLEPFTYERDSNRIYVCSRSRRPGIFDPQSDYLRGRKFYKCT